VKVRGRTTSVKGRPPNSDLTTHYGSKKTETLKENVSNWSFDDDTCFSEERYLPCQIKTYLKKREYK
jgi:hypothetical protein